MGWPQLATPIQTNNSTACGVANDTIKLQRSRAMDMRFYWVWDHCKQGHFNIFWKPGTTNLANDFAKHHAARHHQLMQPVYLHDDKASAAIANALSILQGCAKPAPSRRQTRPNAELELLESQHKTQASTCSQREERLNANSMNNSETSLRIRAYAHS
jgi:siderophore synthetase component